MPATLAGGWVLSPYAEIRQTAAPFLRRPRRTGPRPPKALDPVLTLDRAEGTKSSLFSSGQPFTHSRGMQLQGQSQTQFLHLLPWEREAFPPPPSLTCPKSWRQKGTQSLERFLWDKSRKTPENGLLTTRGLWQELCLQLIKQPFVTCCWGIIINCQF